MSEASTRILCKQHRDKLVLPRSPDGYTEVRLNQGDKVKAKTPPKTIKAERDENTPQPVHKYFLRSSRKPTNPAVMDSSSPETRIQRGHHTAKNLKAKTTPKTIKAERDENTPQPVHKYFLRSSLKPTNPAVMGNSSSSETKIQRGHQTAKLSSQAGGNVRTRLRTMTFPRPGCPKMTRKSVPKDDQEAGNSESEHHADQSEDEQESSSTAAPVPAPFMPPRVEATLASSLKGLTPVSQSTNTKTYSDPSSPRAKREKDSKILGLTPKTYRQLKGMLHATKEENKIPRVYIAIGVHMATETAEWEITTNDKGEARLKIGQTVRNILVRSDELRRKCGLQIVWSMEVLNCVTVEKEVKSAINSILETRDLESRDDNTDLMPFWRGLKKLDDACDKCKKKHKEIYFARNLDLQPLKDLMYKRKEEEQQAIERKAQEKTREMTLRPRKR